MGKTFRKTCGKCKNVWYISIMHQAFAFIQITFYRLFYNYVCAFHFRNEIRQIRGSSIIKAISTAFRGTQIRFQLFISILSYVLLGNSISIQKVSWSMTVNLNIY